MKSDDGILRNVFPAKCPHCEEDLTAGSGITQYAVSSALRKMVLPNGLLKVVEMMRPSPILTVCSSCGTIIKPELCVQQNGKLVPRYPKSDDGVKNTKDGEKLPEIENSGENSPEKRDNKAAKPRGKGEGGDDRKGENE